MSVAGLHVAPGLEHRSLHFVESVPFIGRAPELWGFVCFREQLMRWSSCAGFGL